MAAGRPRTRRGAKSGKKKLIVLAVLLVGGLCVWIPMMFSSGGKSKRCRKSSKAATAGDTRAGAEAGKTGENTSQAKLPVDWRKLRDLLEATGVAMAPPETAGTAAGPGALPQMGVLAARDPFLATLHSGRRRKAVVSSDGGEDLGSGEFDLAAETPREVGLSLGSTVVGQMFRGAIIGGEVGVVGDLVPRVPACRIPEGIELFKLTDVRSQKVLLCRQGQTHTLTMKSLSTPGRLAGAGSSRGRRQRRDGEQGG